jgi:hypothetical protein
MNVVNHIEIVATQTGLKETQASLEGIARSQDTVAKSSLSMEQAFERQERRFNASLRAQQDYEKVARQVNAAVAQNPALMERGNAVLEAAAAKYGQLSRAQQLFSDASKGVSGQLIAMSAGFGPVGVALSAIPGWGLPAAAALGAVSKAMSYASEQSHALGQKAIDLKKFAETTGLTTDEVQAFRFEANKVGIGSDETEGALQKFTVAFESLREGSGSALEVLRRYRPDLAEQMQGVKSTAAAIDILSKAFDGLTTSQQNALSRSFFGRGGIEMTRLMSGLNLGAGTEAFQQSGRGLSQDQIETISRLELENRELKKNWNEGLAKTFAPEVLEAENTYYRTLLQITSELKKLGASGGAAQLLAPAIEFLENPKGEGAKGAVSTDDLVRQAAAKLRAGQVDATTAVPLPRSRPAEADADAGRTISAQLADQQKLLSVLGNIASVQDIIKGKELELSRERERGLKLTQEQSDALMAQATVQAELSQKSPGTFERQLEALNAVKDIYPGLTAADAQRMQALDQQLSILQAMPGQARLAAEEQVRYTQLIDQGRTAFEATAISMKETQVKQAQITAGAREHLAALRDQHAIASARNVDERLIAQEAARYNDLIRQGVTSQQAAAIASQERATAEAQVTVQYEKQLALAEAVTGAQKIQTMQLVGDWREANVAIAEANANVDRQLISLQQQLELIRARANGEEAAVMAAQAYTNAVNAGADATRASALAAQTLINKQEEAAQAALRAANAMRQQEAAAEDSRISQYQSQSSQPRTTTVFRPELLDYGNRSYGGTPLSNNSQANFSNTVDQIREAGIAQAEKVKQDKEQAAQQAVQDQQSKMDAAANQTKADQDRLLQLQNQLLLTQASSDEERARLQHDITYQDQLRSGSSPEFASAIADAELTNTLTELAKRTADNTTATNANTGALDSMSPYYATDPRLSHLGFRPDSGVLDYNPFVLASSGPPGPPALPFGSSTSLASSQAIVATQELTVATQDLTATLNDPSVSHPGMVWRGSGIAGGQWVSANDPYANVSVFGAAKSAGYTDATRSIVNATQMTADQLVEMNRAWARAYMPGIANSNISNARADEIYNTYLKPMSGGSVPSAASRTPNGLPYFDIPAAPATPAVNPNLTKSAANSNDRPVYITLSFNAPVDRDVAAELKQTVYQSIQASGRQAQAMSR